MDYKIGQKVEGTISGVQSYGAFVQMDETTQGLIHISEITHGFVDDIHDFVKNGQRVRVQVMDIDEYTKKISLSLRALEDFEPTQKKKYHHHFGKKKSKTGFQSIEDKMPTWIKEGKEYIKYYHDHHG